MAIGVLLSRIGSTLPLALGISFGFYLIGMYSSVVQSQVARLFSPFKYFNVNIIQASGGYETGYLILYLAPAHDIFDFRLYDFCKKRHENGSVKGESQ
jgi:hypothetical protein